MAVNMRTFSDPKPKVRGENFYLILTRLLAQVNIKTKLHKVNLELKKLREFLDCNFTKRNFCQSL